MINLRFQRVDKNDPRMQKIVQEIFRLRYQVYCTECGFESPGDHPEGIETDKYDDYSSHFCATVVETGALIGTVRIIHTSPLGFPIESLAPNHAFGNVKRAGEISRLAISKEFRRREIDQAIYSPQDIDLTKIRSVHNERRKFESLIVAGLYQCIYHESRKLGLTHWYAVMVKGLAFLLRRWGICWAPIGDEVEYHGLRRPYVLTIDELERQVVPYVLEKPEGWDDPAI